MPGKWEESDFEAQEYRVELGTHPASVTLRVGNEKPVQLTLREPGVIAFISLPTEEGVRVQVLSPTLKVVRDSVEVSKPVSECVKGWLLGGLFGGSDP